METLQDRARAAAVEREMERSADQAKRYDQAKARVEQLAPGIVDQWLADNHLDITASVGTMTTTETLADRWHVSVRFTGPTPDDDLDLVLALELGDLSPDGQPHAWWLVPRTCARCKQTVPDHAGWSLADLGRALERDLDHRDCIERPPVLVERHHLGGETTGPEAAERIAELERDGYAVAATPDEGWLVLVGRRDDLSGAF